MQQHPPLGRCSITHEVARQLASVAGGCTPRAGRHINSGRHSRVVWPQLARASDVYDWRQSTRRWLIPVQPRRGMALRENRGRKGAHSFWMIEAGIGMPSFSEAILAIMSYWLL